MGKVCSKIRKVPDLFHELLNAAQPEIAFGHFVRAGTSAFLKSRASGSQPRGGCRSGPQPACHGGTVRVRTPHLQPPAGQLRRRYGAGLFGRRQVIPPGKRVQTPQCPGRQSYRWQLAVRVPRAKLCRHRPRWLPGAPIAAATGTVYRSPHATHRRTSRTCLG